MSSTQFTPIPQPKTTPLVGNIPDIDGERATLSMMELAREHGPIFQLNLLGRYLIIVSSHELVDELCDESRFDKKLHGPLRELREFAGDGLFTADTDEPNWGKAHRILMPAFGPAALQGMFDGMLDIAEQLLVKWERHGPDQRIDVSDTTTRLTFDTIALCSFSHRFNSLYSDHMPSFVAAMVRNLLEAGARTRRLPLQTKLMLRARHQADEDRRIQFELADQLIDERMRRPSAGDEEDILDRMLTATDPQTGERLPLENVRYQLITFLVAGHETTSGLLTFTLYELLRHPEMMERARAQVDEVLGRRTPQFEDLVKLTYIDQILKETLRLWPTAPAFALKPREQETTLGGRYRIAQDTAVMVLIPQLHRDPAVWGEDAEAFDPDRFEFERASQLPVNAWKPFGNGQRACIGRGFALQEATLFLAMLLQRFEIFAADTDYELRIKQTLTIKPEDLFIHVRRREGAITIEQAQGHPQRREASKAAPVASNGVPVRVLYGSNAGTAQSFAQRIANDARRRGYSATLDALDSDVGRLPGEGAVVIVCASYEGQPPDNAREFVSWLEVQPEGALDGVRYAVFGCGNKDWARTYQAIPKLIDANLARGGARPLVERGEANARGDFLGDFEEWYAGFWPSVDDEFDVESIAPTSTPLLEIEFVPGVREPLLRHQGPELGMVVANRELVDLTASGARAKRHVEIALPEGERYRVGDYLAVLPLNPPVLVDRVLSRFRLAYDAHVVIRADEGGQTFLPTETPVTVGELLSGYVELTQPATRRQIEHLAAASVADEDKRALSALVDDITHYESEILAKRVTVLDLLERYPGCELAFASFLQTVRPLAARRYSISSSPRWSEEHVTLTVAVVSAPAFSGHGIYQGAASTFLAQARPGTRLPVTVRPSNMAFRPPHSLSTPMVMACAGSGIAPFRGFLQDRVWQAQQEGQTPAPSLLFFGCDHPEVDYLYREELEAWSQQSIVDVRPAYSAAPEDGITFVQERIWRDRGDVIDLVQQGATFYVCGDGQNMAPAVFDTCARIYAEATGASPEEAEEWLTEMQRDHARYVADVFA